MNIFIKRPAVDDATQEPSYHLAPAWAKQWASNLYSSFETYNSQISSHVCAKIEYIIQPIDKLCERIDALILAVNKPPLMHPETAILREDTRERIRFLENMVKELTGQPRVISSVTSTPEIITETIEKIVYKDVEKEFIFSDKLPFFTQDNLTECAKLLTDAQLLSIVRARKIK